MDYSQMIQQILEYFNLESLRRWLPSDLDDLELSSESRDYLCNVGLPNVEDIFSQLPSEISGLPELPVIVGQGRLHQLGSGNYLIFAVASNRENRVFAVPDDYSSSGQFVNSSVWQFGYFLMEYDRLMTEGQESLPSERAVALEEMAKRMSEADQAALQDSDDCIWSVQLEMLRDFGIY